MAATVYFVTEAFLKTNAMVTGNVDPNDFAPLVQMASKAFIKKQIGTYFFNDLLSKYNAQTLSDDEWLIVEKMQFAIGWRVSANACYSLTYQLKNKGLQTQQGEFSTNVEDEVVDKMYNFYIQHAKQFESELAEFLCENKDDYPEFTSKLNKGSSIKGSCCGGDDKGWNEGLGIYFLGQNNRGFF